MSFENIFLAEEGFEEKGYSEGYSQGKLKGMREGKRIGHQKAMEVGSEIGFYQGFISTWKLMCESHHVDKTSRKLKLIQTLSSSIENFPVTNTHADNFLEDLMKIRAKFKQTEKLTNSQDDVVCPIFKLLFEPLIAVTMRRSCNFHDIGPLE